MNTMSNYSTVMPTSHELRQRVSLTTPEPSSFNVGHYSHYFMLATLSPRMVHGRCGERVAAIILSCPAMIYFHTHHVIDLFYRLRLPPNVVSKLISSHGRSGEGYMAPKASFHGFYIREDFQ